MTIRQTFTCDHCGALCNGNVYASLWGGGDETSTYSHTRLDGCSMEHLGIVVAAQFGIPIDATVERVMHLETKLADAERVADARLTDLDMLEDKLRHACEEYKKRIAELETLLAKQAQPPPVDATGKTPGGGGALWILCAAKQCRRIITGRAF